MLVVRSRSSLMKAVSKGSTLCTAKEPQSFFLIGESLGQEGCLTVLWLIATEAAASWSNHKDSRQGAALAYYSVFSLGPIIVIAIAVAGFFLR